MWYFTVISDYGTEDYGGYDSFELALEAINRIMRKAHELNDNVERTFSLPELVGA